MLKREGKVRQVQTIWVGHRGMDPEEVLEARRTIIDSVIRTPLVYSKFFSETCGGRVYLKLENQQVTNSFKIRGALNKMLHLTEEEKKHGLVTASAGNHAQAVAIGAEKLNLPVKIVVPKTTPTIKLEKIRTHKVEPILHGEIYDEAEKYAITLAKRERLTYISAYNDNFVIAGQGTVGLEVLEDLPNVSMIIVPVGGGGLISGIGLTVKSSKPNVKIIGVQSEASPVMYESLKAGRLLDTELHESIADGIYGGVEKGSITFEMIRNYVDDFWLVKEKTIRKAIYLLWKEEKQVVEGSGAVPVAALLENKHALTGQIVAAVISGGNIDEQLFQKVISREGA
ncbi:MAG: threonine/serine dehydratase [Candidatus Bathyarchaeia archaeon]